MVDDLKVWLENLGLGKYADAFSDNDVGPDVLDLLTKDDLEKMGISLGDRLRLVRAIGTEASRVSGTVAPAATAPSIAPLAAPAPSSDAEHRPLTVMFCDLADSTALSTRLDPEDLQDVIRAYRETCTRHIQEYEGFVAKYMGDGILVYFGYPKSLERNAERAVRSALDIVAATVALNRTLGREKDVEIAVRVGIATGMVMVGELVGEGLAQERTVIGEAPNMAARLQGLAGRNGIVVGSLTRELTGSVFEFDDLGSHELKGISGLVQTWGVTGLRGEDGGASHAGDKEAIAAPVLVGRDEEIGLLRRAWQITTDETRGQVVTLTGEAGIGKSALIDGLKAGVRAEGLPQLTMRCSPYHTNSALYPVIEHFKRLARWQSEDDAAARLDKLERMLGHYAQPLGETMPLIAALLSQKLPEGSYPPLDLTPQQQKQQTQDMIVGITMEVAESQPFLQLWEDLHWADPSTLELIGLLIEQAPTASLLMVLTARPEFAPPWPARSHITPITLNRLERPHAEALVARIAGAKPLPEEVVDHIVTKTDGVPLYVEELTKTILASDILRDTGESYELTGPLSSLSIPDTLQESLMARLDRLPEVRELAQLGAVLGREFAYEMILSLGSMDEPGLLNGLSQLVEDEILYQRGRPPRARYIFKHALIQDAAYQSILRRTRQEYHRQVAGLILDRFPETVEAHPELIAHHCIEAGMTTEAIDYCYLAGERARSRCAYREAIAHLGKGISVAGELADQQEREASELRLQFSLGGVYLQMKGHMAPEVEAAFVRARELCQRVRGSPELVPTMFGLWRTYVVQLADSRKPLEVAGELLRLAEKDGSATSRVVAHYASGFTALVVGDLQAACEHLQEGIRLYSPEDRDTAAVYRFGQDPCVACLCYLAIAKWLLGYPDEAIGHAGEAVAMARGLNDPFTIAFSNGIVSFLDQALGDNQAVLAKADEAVDLATEKGFPLWDSIGKVMQGWGRAIANPTRKTVLDLKERIEHHRATGTELFAPYFYAILGEVALAAGALDDCAEALDRASEITNQTGEGWWESEIHRLRGDLLLARSDDSAEAERHFDTAIATARRNGARSLELRAATGLAAQWRQCGKPREARDLLSQLYEGFTEGFETANLTKARALIEDRS
jgi:predicted ATPase/class 3 adenylate cyclase